MWIICDVRTILATLQRRYPNLRRPTVGRANIIITPSGTFYNGGIQKIGKTPAEDESKNKKMEMHIWWTRFVYYTHARYYDKRFFFFFFEETTSERGRKTCEKILFWFRQIFVIGMRETTQAAIGKKNYLFPCRYFSLCFIIILATTTTRTTRTTKTTKETGFQD